MSGSCRPLGQTLTGLWVQHRASRGPARAPVSSQVLCLQICSWNSSPPLEGKAHKWTAEGASSLPLALGPCFCSNSSKGTLAHAPKELGRTENTLHLGEWLPRALCGFPPESGPVSLHVSTRPSPAALCLISRQKYSFCPLKLARSFPVLSQKTALPLSWPLNVCPFPLALFEWFICGHVEKH